jgi:hypothetical protein
MSATKFHIHKKQWAKLQFYISWLVHQGLLELNPFRITLWLFLKVKYVHWRSKRNCWWYGSHKTQGNEVGKLKLIWVQYFLNKTRYILLFGSCHVPIFKYRRRSWLRYCAKSRKVAGLIPDGVFGIFHWRNPSCRTMTLRLTHPLTKLSTRNNSWG